MPPQAWRGPRGDAGERGAWAGGRLGRGGLAAGGGARRAPPVAAGSLVGPCVCAKTAAGPGPRRAAVADAAPSGGGAVTEPPAGLRPCRSLVAASVSGHSPAWLVALAACVGPPARAYA